jgi:hypothetical protein
MWAVIRFARSLMNLIKRTPARAVALVALAAAGAAAPAAPDAASAAQDATVRMDPYVVVAPRAKTGPLNGLWDGLGKSLDWAVGKKFMNLRGGPLLDAIYFRVNYLSDHPNEKAIVVVSSEPVHGRVTAATVVFTEEGGLYASSAALGNHQRLSGFTAADIDHPDRIKQELQSRRDFYLEMYEGWNAGHVGGDALVAPFLTSNGTGGTTTTLNMSRGSSADLMSQGPLMPGAAMAQAEETGDYSILERTGQRALMADYGGAKSGADSKEKLDVAYSVLHERTMLPVARANLALAFASEGKSTPPVPQAVDVLVFDWGQIHYIYNPDLGTYGAKIPRNLITGLPTLAVERGDALESLYFIATFRAQHPPERAVFLPASDGVHAGVAYTLPGKLWIYSPALGKFSLSSKYRIEDVATLAKLHAVLVARQLAKGIPAATATVDHLPGDTADLQVRRAYLALRDVGFKCQLGRTQDRPTLTVSWPAGTYTYTAPSGSGSR